MKEVRFTKHAYEKFALLKKYGFPIDEAAVRQAIASPTQLGRRGDQLLALKPISNEHDIRVVYEEANDNIVVITFYPVKRERFNV